MRKSTAKLKTMTEFDTRLQAIFDGAEAVLDELDTAKRLARALAALSDPLPPSLASSVGSLNGGLIASIDQAAEGVSKLQRETFGPGAASSRDRGQP